MKPSRKRAPIGFGTGRVASGSTFEEASGRSPASRGAADVEAGAISASVKIAGTAPRSLTGRLSQLRAHDAELHCRRGRGAETRRGGCEDRAVPARPERLPL